MSEHVRKNEKREEFSLGMTFMGFLMGIGAIGGIWFLSGLLELLTTSMG